MPATLTRSTGVICLEDSIYRNKRPKLTAGADISDPMLVENVGFHTCREILISEANRMHFDRGDELLTGRQPWIAMECLRELRQTDLRVFHATVGVMGALLAPAGMECIEPLAEQRTVLGTSLLVCGGYPVWTQHAALASLMLYQLRLAHFIIVGGMADEFLDLLPQRGMRLSTAIRDRDHEHLMAVLDVIQTSVYNLHLDWECLNQDDRYWTIVHSLIEARISGKTNNDLYKCREVGWSEYNGTLSWWFGGGASMLGHYDYWDESPDEENDEDEDY